MSKDKRKMKAVIASFLIVVAFAVIAALAYIFIPEVKQYVYEQVEENFYLSETFLGGTPSVAEIIIGIIVECILTVVCLSWLLYDYHWRAVFRLNTIIAFIITFFVTAIVFAVMSAISSPLGQIMVYAQMWYIRLFRLSILLGGSFYISVSFFLTIFLVWIGYDSETNKIATDPKNRPMDRNELEQRGIIEVLKKARKKSTPLRVRFYMRTDATVNGFAHGKNIVLNIGCFNVDKDILNSVVAHEIAHVRNHDALVNHIISVPSKIYIKPMWFATKYISLSVRWVPLIGKPLSGAIEFLLGWFNYIVMYIYTKLAWILGGRLYEQKADNFAVDLGYGKGHLMNLKNYIEKAPAPEKDLKKRINALLEDNHPNAVARYKRALKRIRRKKLIPEEQLKYWGLDQVPAKPKKKNAKDTNERKQYEV